MNTRSKAGCSAWTTTAPQSIPRLRVNKASAKQREAAQATDPDTADPGTDPTDSASSSHEVPRSYCPPPAQGNRPATTKPSSSDNTTSKPAPTTTQRRARDPPPAFVDTRNLRQNQPNRFHNHSQHHAKRHHQHWQTRCRTGQTSADHPPPAPTPPPSPTPKPSQDMNDHDATDLMQRTLPPPSQSPQQQHATAGSPQLPHTATTDVVMPTQPQNNTMPSTDNTPQRPNIDTTPQHPHPTTPTAAVLSMRTTLPLPGSQPTNNPLTLRIWQGVEAQLMAIRRLATNATQAPIARAAESALADLLVDCGGGRRLG